ncbi:hypothetical protein COLU111180_06660 [Cohnella lubricantis]|uniref:DUF2140 family protein n=1 Tax=Cohnella lubricantis TaxID=2163172 RepID=A0A841TI94_9BACL|nr:hypothetical protein [Cohnella lubricantis]MBB6678667.1 hypothetical protein [Cohnella lubricantis]MBP2119172.1 hypothetical protein [Cohnella lubricantis]
MRKLLAALIILILLLGGAAAFAYWYVSPPQQLGLDYEEVPLRSRALDMARRMSPELVLTEADVNNLGRQQVAAHRNYQPDVELTGARFRLEGGKLVADVTAKWKDRVPVGLQLTYRLRWASPNLIAQVEEAKLKNVGLPAEAFDDIVIPLGNELPEPLHVNDIRIESDQLVVEFRKPSLQDLRSLLG